MAGALKVRRVEGSSGNGAAPQLAVKLSNAKLIEPLLYGDALVGISAIYAVTNALRLAVAHRQRLTAAEAYKVMAAGFGYWSGRLSPAQAFQSGCRVSHWRGLAQAMTETARRQLGIQVFVDRLVIHAADRASLFSAIEEAIGQWRPVLMLCRGGRYTVVSGFTPSSLLLFDGGGAHWLAKHACGVPGDCENARHMLYPASLMALSA
jgi:hypothetical protein